MNEHELASSIATVTWGRLPARGFTPALEVASGDLLTVDTLSHEGLLEDQGRDPVAFFGRFGVAPDDVLPDAVAIARDGDHDQAAHGPHVVTGPVVVTGADVGDVVEVEFLRLDRRADYGIVSNRHGKGALPGELPAPDDDGAIPAVVSTFATAAGDQGRIVAPSGATARFPLAPFLGIVGVALDRDDAPSSVPPGDHGGNLDIRHLGVATRLFLPVQLAGAGLYVGDPHFSQGDGEVALTAFEASLRATIRVTLHRGAADGWHGPLGADAEHWDRARPCTKISTRPCASRQASVRPPLAGPPRLPRPGHGAGVPERRRRPPREPGGRRREGRPLPDPQSRSGR